MSRLTITLPEARDLVRRARAHSKLNETQAVALAQEQVRAVRRKSLAAAQSLSTRKSSWPAC